MKIIPVAPRDPYFDFKLALHPYKNQRVLQSRHWSNVVAVKYGGPQNPNAAPTTQFYVVPVAGGTVRFGLRYPGTCVDKAPVVLHTLSADPIGAGLGTKALSYLCKLCDRHRVSLLLRAQPGHGSKMSRAKLIDWYHSFGFNNSENSRVMLRKPNRS